MTRTADEGRAATEAHRSVLPAGWSRRLRASAGALVGLGLFLLALYVLHREAHDLRWADVRVAAEGLPGWRVLLGVGLVVACYLVQSLYDLLSLRIVGAPRPWRQVAPVAVLAQVLGQNLGGNLFTGGAVRVRAWLGWGLTGREITRGIAANELTVWLGFSSALGGLLVATGPPLPPALPAWLPGSRWIGALLLLLPLGWVALAAVRRAPLRVGRWTLALPASGLATLQPLVGALDWLLAEAVLVALLPGLVPGDVPRVMALVLLAHLVGAVSYVPGGAGVFEASLVLLLRPTYGRADLLGTALLFRVLYYLGPLVLALAGLGVIEWRRREVSAVTARIARGLAPLAAAVLTFGAGAVILVSGVLPAVPARLHWLRGVLPLALVEESHLGASLVGLGLMLLARALQRRVHLAWILSEALLFFGVGLALTRGLDWEEALVLGGVAMLLVPTREAFYRTSALVGERFTPSWLAAVGAVLVASVLLGVVHYRESALHLESWMRFDWHRGDAPRFLRATLAVALAMLVVGVARLIRPRRRIPAEPTAEELARALPIVRASPEPDAWLALLGDKHLLFDEAGTAFVMYGVQGRSWVAMGEPIGPEEAHEELLWQFQELARREGFRPVFYQIREGSLARYVDLGLMPFKLGEDARVPLPAFGLEGKARKKLRGRVNKIEREGATFEVLRAPIEPAVLARLRTISDGWLAEKHTREKGFSLGWFTEGYVARCPVATVSVEGRILAFANLWPGGDRGVLSVDLMRHATDAPSGVMEYLFVELMLWGKAEGYAWFDLGMSPLSGLVDRPSAPLWHKLGVLAFRHGEHFYNFEGLRAFKEKFDPTWSSRYLLVSGGLALPGALVDIAALVSRGLGGVVAR